MRSDLARQPPPPQLKSQNKRRRKKMQWNVFCLRERERDELSFTRVVVGCSCCQASFSTVTQSLLSLSPCQKQKKIVEIELFHCAFSRVIPLTDVWRNFPVWEKRKEDPVTHSSCTLYLFIIYLTILLRLRSGFLSLGSLPFFFRL